MEQAELNAKLADPVHFQKAGFVSETKVRLMSIEAELEDAYRLWQELESRSY